MDKPKPIIPVIAPRIPTEQEDMANLPKREAKDYSSHLPLDSEPGRMNKPARTGANFDEKIYMFPESFNALRMELHDHWPSLWAGIDGHIGAGWLMAFDAVAFVELMDATLDTRTTFDSDKVDAICAKYLDLLRVKRGLSRLNPQLGS